MNERMLELYGQAWVPHTAIDPSNNMPYESKIFSADKFAELIIKECAEVCFQHSQSAGGEDTAFGFGYKECGDDIKKIFGVEQ